MSVQSAKLSLLAAALFLGASMPSTLADSVAAIVSSAEVVADEPQEGVMDAVFEAAYTLLAFGVAALIIRYLQQRHAVNTKLRSKQRKESISESLCSSSRAWKPSSPGRTPVSTSANGAPKAPAAAQPAAADAGKKKHVIKEGRYTIVGECNAVVAGLRDDRAKELPALLAASFARLVPSSADAAARTEAHKQFCQSALRICAGRRHFQEALTIYDQMVAQYDLQGSSDMWSVLLFCAVESQDFRRCKDFAMSLLESTTPSGNDFVNMVRYTAGTHDVAGFKQLVGMLSKSDFELDVISRNRALAACVSNKALWLAEILADDLPFAPEHDLVGYNSFMKCCTQSGDSDRCFKTYGKMCTAGLAPSEVTFGILLDACNISNDVERATAFFRDLRESGLRPNAIHYTSFMRVLAGAGLLELADELLEEMMRSSDTKPDLVTYSTLVKAHADRGDVKGAMRVLERMIGNGAKPDAIIFNVVMNACTVTRMDSVLVMHVYKRLAQHGMKTTNTSLSVLLKALARNQDWDASLAVLAEAPERWELVPEARLYAQIAQACRNANGGGGVKILECYVAMVRSAARTGARVDLSISSRLLRLCSASGQEPAASGIHSFLLRSGGLVSARELDHMLQAVSLASP